jgi:hypothetical protein
VTPGAAIDHARQRLTDRAANHVTAGQTVDCRRERLTDGVADDVPPRRTIDRGRERQAGRATHDVAAGPSIHLRVLLEWELRARHVHHFFRYRYLSCIYLRYMKDACQARLRPPGSATWEA